MGYEPDELPTALPRDMVPETGVEPARDHSHGILSPGRLPIPPLRHGWLPVLFLKAKIAYHKLTGVSRGKNVYFSRIFFPLDVPNPAHILACPAYIDM